MATSDWPPSDATAKAVFGASYAEVCARVCGGMPDDEFFKDIIEDYFEYMPTRTRDAHAALEALESGVFSITSAAGRAMEPWEAIKGIVHGIKGTAGNTGLMRIHVLAKRTEEWMAGHRDEPSLLRGKYEGLIREVEVDRKALGLPPAMRRS